MTNDEPDEASPESTVTVPTPVFPVVGIGASAGGVDALRRLFPAVQPDCGMAFVVVQHLDPERHSALAEILSGTTGMPVRQIRDRTVIEPNHVYVIPPNTVVTLHGTQLRLTPRASPRAGANTIDEFFLSLARERGERAACVILSGTGSDGTIGLRAVKESGGLTLAQAGAEYDGMMRSAVATGLVDFVLPPEAIPEKIVTYFRHAAEIDQEPKPEAAREIIEQLGQITGLLRTHTGHDFANYKDSTIIRRVRRRMHVLHIDNITTFVERLRQEPREVSLLFQDLLIGVTSFFRDAEAFAALERLAIPELFKGKGAADTVRVWVPGCATGEEAYSIAMLLREHAPQTDKPKLQIFASDIDETALEIARVGRYPATIARDVPPQYLGSYFLREDGTYRITADLREVCLFSSHNLLRDAPFSRLDLISCRNLLIYLTGELQDRVIPLFHYALAPNGFLFLGTSENVTRHSRLFQTTDKVHRVFRRRAFPERRIPEFPLTTPDATRRQQHAPAQRTGGAEANLRNVAERQLLDRFAPAWVVTDIEGDLLQASARTGKYLELPPGAPDTNIFSMARSGLRLELRAALHRATSSGSPVVQSRVSVGINGERQEIDLIVQPLRYGGNAENLYLVVFQDVGPVQPQSEQSRMSAEEVGETSARHLEAELRATKERLQTTTEELEASNEELKSGNEELQSMNEELQSTNEELETSKEELQSVNEELQTVNAELSARVDELSRANNDMRNLLDSTQIATVFLDRMLNVKSFTPAAKDVFRLVESDAGRPLSHVRALFACETLQEDAERVLRTLGTIERPVVGSEKNTRYMMRILPYRTAENVISGVVLTFTDVTRISAAEAQIEQLTRDLRARIAELETLLELVPVGVMIEGSDDHPHTLINTFGIRLLGGDDGQKGLITSAPPFRLFAGDREVPHEDQPLQCAMRNGEPVSNWQGRLQTAAGRSTHVMISATPLFGETGRVRGAVAAIVDVTEHKLAEEKQQELLHELQHRVKNILATVNSLATRLARRSDSIEAFREGFLSRIAAMGRMHDLLAGGAPGGTGLRSLIQVAVEPYAERAGRNVTLNGKDVRLTPACAATIGMVLHELTTNASKYGALSIAEGVVDVSWELLDNQSLRLRWSERGGPEVHETKAGFGTNFIKRSVEYDLRGTTTCDFAPTGFCCTMEFPLGGNVEGYGTTGG